MRLSGSFALQVVEFMHHAMLDTLLEGESPDEPLRTTGNRIEDNLSPQFWVTPGAYHFRLSFPRWINSVCSVGGMRPEIRMTKYPSAKEARMTKYPRVAA